MTETPRPADESTTAAPAVENVPSHPVVVTEAGVAANSKPQEVEDTRREDFDQPPANEVESFDDDSLDELADDDATDEVSLEEPKAPSATSAPDQEFDLLFAQWRATGDPRARERLILMHRNLVTYLARRFLDRGELYDDIMQQGLIGLINALDHFDPTRGVRFATFATPTIIGEIRRYFRDKTWTVRVPRRLQELHQVIHRKIEALTQELDRSPTYMEIARSLNIEIEQVIEALEMSHAMEPASLDEPTAGDGDSTMSVADHLGAPDPALEHWSEHAALHAALERLPQRQQTVLKLAYFEGFSQAEIARRIHVSPMHVSRLQRRALAQLREYLEDSSL